jgi:hypothetical protein
MTGQPAAVPKRTIQEIINSTYITFDDVVEIPVDPNTTRPSKWW